MAYWVTRDEKDNTVSTYDFWRGKPTKISKWWEQSDTACEHLVSIYPGVFSFFFKTRLKPGEIRKVKSINIVLEELWTG